MTLVIKLYEDYRQQTGDECGAPATQFSHCTDTESRVLNHLLSYFIIQCISKEQIAYDVMKLFRML